MPYYKLDLDLANKSGSNMGDIMLTPHQHWALEAHAIPDRRQRLQVISLILPVIFTSTRLGAVLSKGNIKCSLDTKFRLGPLIWGSGISTLENARIEYQPREPKTASELGWVQADQNIKW